ncbi:MAG TPA: addiction module protein [Thermoanaerobaculia bacterium]|jgi:putative addiction module component (TIGR02574 family)
MVGSLRKPESATAGQAVRLSGKPKEQRHDGTRTGPDPGIEAFGVGPGTCLIVSLDDDFDHDVELAWQQEIQRRLAEIDRGEVACVPWEEVRDRLSQRRRASA